MLIQNAEGHLVAVGLLWLALNLSESDDFVGYLLFLRFIYTLQMFAALLSFQQLLRYVAAAQGIPCTLTLDSSEKEVSYRLALAAGALF